MPQTPEEIAAAQANEFADVTNAKEFQVALAKIRSEGRADKARADKAESELAAANTRYENVFEKMQTMTTEHAAALAANDQVHAVRGALDKHGIDDADLTAFLKQKYKGVEAAVPVDAEGKPVLDAEGKPGEAVKPSFGDWLNTYAESKPPVLAAYQKSATTTTTTQAPRKNADVASQRSTQVDASRSARSSTGTATETDWAQFVNADAATQRTILESQGLLSAPEVKG